MKRWYWLIITLAVAAVVAWVMLSYQNTFHSGGNILRSEGKPTQESHPVTENTEHSSTSPAKGPNTQVPAKVYEIYNYILRFKSAPPGYVGGRIFQNREKLLPQIDHLGIRIKYREWDVNPKIKGVNRGAERLVTGSDGKAYYTKDHYKSFIQL